MNTEQFIQRAGLVHGKKYDYSKVVYNGSTKKVIITCPEHGDFEQTPNNHLMGRGCPKCSGGVKQSTEEFIQKAKQVHGDKYDYSKIDYKNSRTKVVITCPIHGDFEQLPSSHLRGNGCPKCAKTSLGSANIARLERVGFVRKGDSFVRGNDEEYVEVKRGVRGFVIVLHWQTECGTYWKQWEMPFENWLDTAKAVKALVTGGNFEDLN